MLTKEEFRKNQESWNFFLDDEKFNESYERYKRGIKEDKEEK